MPTLVLLLMLLFAFLQGPTSAFHLHVTGKSARFRHLLLSSSKLPESWDKGQIPGKPITALLDKGSKLIGSALKNLPGPVKDLIKKIDTYIDSTNVKEKFTKEELAKLGLYALLSYGFVSNFSYITCVIIAWCMHGKATGLSPLAHGQWKGFLALYTGLYIANNFLRPARFGLSVILAPQFENIIQFLMKKLKLNKTYATALTVFLVNFCGIYFNNSYCLSQYT